MSYQMLWCRLAKIYDEGEAKAIARMVYEMRYGLSLSDLLMGRDADVPQQELESIAQRLERHEPVQYVLGEATFCGRQFQVRPGVLIPRPETAELCQWIIHEETGGRRQETKAILDIGTGSGCIAITLAAAIPESDVTAWDISETALTIAEENAKRNHINVTFQQVDVLTPSTLHTPHSSKLDLIVSNPPYICNQERTGMEQNVLDYEPHTALFVPDEDPLLFYRAIAGYGQKTLKENGRLYFEINPIYTASLRQLLTMMSYHDIEIKKDAFDKQRMIRAIR